MAQEGHIGSEGGSTDYSVLTLLRKVPPIRTGQPSQPLHNKQVWEEQVDERRIAEIGEQGANMQAVFVQHREREQGPASSFPPRLTISVESTEEQKAPLLGKAVGSLQSSSDQQSASLQKGEARKENVVVLGSITRKRPSRCEAGPVLGLGCFWPRKRGEAFIEEDDVHRQMSLKGAAKDGSQLSGPPSPTSVLSPTADKLFSPPRKFILSLPSHSWMPPLFSPILPLLAPKSETLSTICLRSKGLLAALSYSAASCGMVLMNKLVLSRFEWRAHTSLMLLQNSIVASIVLMLRAAQVVPREPLPWRLVRLWLPVNVIFVGMLITSFLSLQYLQVAMATILKNCTNLITALGDMYLSNTRHDLQVWLSLFLMILSAFCSGYTDLSFNAVGYTWQLINCVLTASYVLTLRHVMKSARKYTVGGGPLDEFSMVLLNSVLSLPLGLVLAFSLGEVKWMLESPVSRQPGFWIAASLSGLMGLAISFTSMWCLHLTSPTTFSLIGSFNKIPLSLLGIAMFNGPTSPSNLSSIGVGLFGGVLFARAKAKQAKL